MKLKDIPHIYPLTMSKHLQSIWCKVRNEMLQDANGIDRCESSIKTNQDTIVFLRARLEDNLKALRALEGVS